MYVEPSGKHPGTIVQGRQPLKVESPQYLLRQSFVTPTELLYTRNRGTIPEVVPGSYRLTVLGVAERPLELWLEEIRDEFPKVTVTTTYSVLKTSERDLWWRIRSRAKRVGCRGHRQRRALERAVRLVIRHPPATVI